MVVSAKDVKRNGPFKVTVELPCFLVLFGSSLSNGITSNLLLYRTCVNDLNYNSSECDLLLESNKTDEAKELETQVEGHVTLLLLALSVYSGVLPAVLSLFLGGWSDNHGRKPLTVYPVIGLCITALMSTVYCAIPSLGAWWFLPCMIPLSLFGGYPTFLLGANLLITEITKEGVRSFRLSVLQGCCFIGVLIGTMSSSYIYEALGYTYLFMLLCFFYVMTLLYLLICVEEPLDTVSAPQLKTLFNFDSLRNLYETCTKPRPLNVSIILGLMITACGLTVMCVNGLLTVEYLFTRVKFNWQIRDYTIFNGITMICIISGMVFGMAFIQKFCKMRDGVLLGLAYTSSILDSLLRGLAQQPWHMYVAASTAILSGLTTPLIKSQVSKTVPSEEVGKVFSLMSCVEAITPVFIAPSIFNTIYYKTLTTFPGAIFIVACILYVFCLIFSVITEILQHKLQKATPYLNLDETPTQTADQPAD